MEDLWINVRSLLIVVISLRVMVIWLLGSKELWVENGCAFLLLGVGFCLSFVDLCVSMSGVYLCVFNFSLRISKLILLYI
ncbi:hypothetical protein Lalb_Chr20g0117981 [Lupinus albus]|uniref:Uncharacterized protein n=1 Tax=Lupinus albus TaxID=3870 RepID=A0A6A4NPH7_LUPAL|nr:hypothetical protein Lalb_Chr20g0117981 [Lupinus albus]